MTHSPQDAALVHALALHYDDLVEYIRRRFQGSQFAREVVHDVCVQLLEKPPQQPVKVPFAFLRRATFNRAIDRRRADSTRDARFEAVAEVSDWHMHDLDGAAALDFEQQLEALLAIIDALPARARQVFLLHRIHDMPQREIAEELGISVNMVTQHFARAMRDIARDWEPARLALAGGRRQP
ncbi:MULTISPECIES: RNA polymerase sigma factor [unclassified Pseudomonas]|uniref:sigma-70 family RNA polymerase sigma factor n=1 Tax=unclassified Pseudomonas TaxID=196821 RepID=UPI00244852F0|nr:MULTISPECIES: RNA polymerase sigma factor [unclassified Pseudomonas]MDG9930743.1 RNA polymerase sigma factor [Pseudomonas sp. GD04042]MDH0481552.1 RNA polymerase sigma factor [Pseudomonas sp. GD04015]MDH0603500.1 RNA polymerase sigma factor [Pseudomonas sp. GD03869]